MKKKSKIIWFCTLGIIVGAGLFIFVSRKRSDLLVTLNLDTSIDIDKVEICGPTLIKDAGFEDTVVKYTPYSDRERHIGYWLFASAYYSEKSNVKIGEEEGLNASRCVMISLSLDDHNWTGGFSQKLAFDQLPPAILAQCWIRTESLKGRGAGIHVSCFNFEKAHIYPEGVLAYVESRRLSGTTSWTKVSIALRVPPETAEICVVAGASGKAGKAFFDDFNVFPVTEK